jgi:uncharacterized membrane protein YgaE (UPF0421/DUF939 family)
MLNKEQRNFLFYLLECLAGTVIGFIIYRFYPVIGAWSLFSIILVIAPDRKDVLTLAANRIKANLLGALVGLALSYFYPVSLPMICTGIAVAMLLCEWLKLSAVTKSAIVAILIITMHEPGRSFWNIALERASGVLLGCIIGVVLTHIFHTSRAQSSRIFSKIKERH